ncbi:hypothetical protein BR93DRAFT_901834 [Coniochaeta sp. PMI_546]|nr:hypothetical protein BR93DRAFT_901834 [Coniochaeta sp. PMI_546]
MFGHPVTSQATPAFGTSSPSPANTTAGTGTFGQPKTAPAFGTSSPLSANTTAGAGTFGQPKTNQAAPAFGTSSPWSTNTTVGTGTFGQPKTSQAAPAFGTSSPWSVKPGTPTSTVTSGHTFGSAFGSTPAFGGQAKPAPPPGSEPATGFGTGPATRPLFGASNQGSTSATVIPTTKGAQSTFHDVKDGLFSIDRLHSITAIDEYKKFSPEELRLNDYRV